MAAEARVMSPALAWLAIALLPACTLIIDRDSLSSGYTEPGSAGSAGSSAACVVAADDIYCDGLDSACMPVAMDAACPEGCTGITNENRAYMGCTISSTFEQAQTRCQAQQMHLLRIDGGGENQFAMELARTLGSYVWIGGSNRADESRFEWTDGAVFYENGGPVPSVYQNFGPDQPAADAERRCVQLHDSTGFWSTARCSDNLQFVCGR